MAAPKSSSSSSLLLLLAASAVVVACLVADAQATPGYYNAPSASGPKLHYYRDAVPSVDIAQVAPRVVSVNVAGGGVEAEQLGLRRLTKGMLKRQEAVLKDPRFVNCMSEADGPDDPNFMAVFAKCYSFAGRPRFGKRTWRPASSSSRLSDSAAAYDMY